MTLSALLNEKVINPSLRSRDKEGVLRELVQMLYDAGKIKDKEEVLKALLDREALMSTGIGYGIAIPHAKSKSVNNIIVAFGRSEEGVDYQALDGEPVYLIFLIMASEDALQLHIKALAKISRLLKNAQFREALRRAKAAKEILELFRKEEAKLF